MSDVYISYARQETPRAEMLAHAFEEAGISVWWDRQIAAGEAWANLIERELENTGCVVVLWSATSVQSQWVIEEAKYALEMGKLLPVVTENVQVPLGFRNIPSVSLTDWNGELIHPNFRSLLQAVRMLVGRFRTHRQA